MMSTPSAARSDPSAPQGLERYSLLTYLFDQVFKVPGTSWRFGLDAILGLIPGVGDVVTALVGAYGILIARQLGAPASIQVRMLGNLMIDTLFGAIPFFGDLFDFAFKAHVRNRMLLENWLARPHATQRSSTLLLVGLSLVFALLITGAVWLAIVAVRALLALVA